MTQRRRRKRQKQRRHEPRDRPDRLGRQIVAGAGATVGATLLMGGVAQAACNCTVNSLADPSDPGHTTLRDAITSANVNPGSTITFASGLSGTITLDGTELPTIIVPTTISGPGASQITVSGNNASGIFYVEPTNSGDPVSISGLTISGGDSSFGGGIRVSYAALTVSDSVISGNYSSSEGGGIAVDGGSLTVIGSTVSGNVTSNDRGSGIYTESGSGTTSTIRSSTLSGNSGAYFGGGVYFDYSSQATIDNSTIYGNSANQGGGVYDYGAATANPGLTVTSSTITHNDASVRGGGIASTDGADYQSNPILRNTIVFGNTSPLGPDLSSDTAPIRAGFSLIGSVDPATAITQTGPDIFGQNPQLGPLASNGGPTLTQLPSTTSPVIDKGNAFGLNSDQRGVLRPIDFPAIPNAAGGDGSDIGAVELQPSNAFKLGKLKRNKKKGTAKQVVILPLPDAGSVTIKGKGLKTKTRQVTGAANVKLPVIAKGKKHKALNSSGKAKIKAQVIYNATGNAAKTIKRKLKLLKG